MRKFRVALTGFVMTGALAGALPMSAAAQAQQDPMANEARTLDELLERVRAVRRGENELYDQRVAEFNAASKSKRAALMRQAEQRRDQLAAQADKMSDQYSANERSINDLNRDLVQKASKLGLSELFGLARQVAGDVAGTLDQSLIATQFPVAENATGRVEFLHEFADSHRTPTPAELERLWFEMHREMTAQGEVARYQAPVVQPSGESAPAEVIRIGPFTAMSDGQFLSYLPELRKLAVLSRQLPGEFMSVAGDFSDTTEGYTRAVVDYTRGVLLALYVERPNWLERINRGEEVGYVIIVVGVAGALAFLYQLVHLIFVQIAVRRQLANLDEPRRDNPLGRVLLAFRGDVNRIEEDADVAELRISEAVLREVPKLERFQAFLRLAVAAGPLLGLIGTVVGMIITFQSITESGSSDPRLMANGIGRAMIATVLGLGIAIPLLFANALLNGLSRTVVQILDEQSAGMLAESIEKQRRA
ncbi:MAG TPA: MotA/TolQ/ExbB proton channel family protein [Woeseiaceae bacterium]|nr:MotA/TolQ/ExbB proton channel family protein [Woeseiaceae bacterium]